VTPDRAFFHELARELDMTPAALLLRAMLARCDIDSVIVGMETPRQLRENIAILQSPRLSPDTLARVNAFERTCPEWLIDPPQWADRAAKG
jgi:aryl-alcohol dehydrogenase-like predicted oxidoreductase